MAGARGRGRWVSARLLSVLAMALIAFLFFLPRPLNLIPVSTAVPPRPNPVESAPIVTSPAVAKPEKIPEPPARLEAIPAAGIHRAMAKRKYFKVYCFIVLRLLQVKYK